MSKFFDDTMQGLLEAVAEKNAIGCGAMNGEGKSIFKKIAYCESLEEQEKLVEIVRCKDCDVPHNKWTGCPKLNGLVTPPDFYCAFGICKEKDK